MALPEDWKSVNWNQSVIILPDMTEGLPTVLIKRYPQQPRGFYMMAYLDAQSRRVVGYNAADVGDGGQLVSEFVFLHEVGHHVLGHTNNLHPDDMVGVTYTNDKELDADQYACTQWLGRGKLHGLQVVRAAMDYFIRQGNAPGDAAHPPAAERLRRLRQLVQAKPFYAFTINNDHVTPVAFVREVLAQCFGYAQTDPVVNTLIQQAQTNGAVTLPSKADGSLIDGAEATRITQFVAVKQKMAGQLQFNMSNRVIAMP